MFILLLSVLEAFALSSVTLARLQKLYPDQSRSFLLQRLSSAHSTFERLRDFPPYYYEMLDRLVKLPRRDGFCAGDPHYENFGFIFAAEPFFTLNDLDDSAPCNVNTDALRLLVGHRLLFSDLDLTRWVSDYEAGLSGNKRALPDELLRFKKLSESNARGLSKKYRTSWEARKCKEDLIPATEEEIELLKAHALSSTLVLACSRTKTTGGSAGLTRIIGFYLSPELTVEEFKPLKTPAPLYALNLSATERSRIYSRAVATFLHGIPGVFAFNTSQGLYQRRTLISGNVAVEIKDILNKEIAYYEAYVLGTYHRGTSRSLSQDEWQKNSDLVISTFEKEFAL